MYWGEDETGMKGEYELYGEEIRLDAGPRYTLDEDGNLVDSSGEKLYSAEPPNFVYDIVFDDDNDDDGEYENVLAPDDERFEADESDEAYDFCGCWEYQDYYVWVDIRDDGTYEWVDGDNASSGSYTMEEDELVLDNGLRLSLLKIGGLLDSDGHALFPSELPE